MNFSSPLGVGSPELMGGTPKFSDSYSCSILPFFPLSREKKNNHPRQDLERHISSNEPHLVSPQ